ncbi:MAG: C40 family peptidase [Maritimibacter sp.]|uniref:NlpC/P60 family protein n=1 Tax=Maritimibacter sp. TaxID=2003363 RepID=UPI001DB9B4A6|nr:NlpC/P60 family protein [Maritimibacter sp.]MBL6429351.1 C40 family peptidase [Maritimibacter sp.]
MIRADALAEARTWIGTPYRHQASCKGAGTDCLGLIRGIWRALYGGEPVAIPPYTPDWSEPSRDEVLMRTATALLTHVERPDPGDVLLFRMRDKGVAKHLGVLATSETFIHAYSGHGVVESSLSAPWRRRIVGTFRFPERG